MKTTLNCHPLFSARSTVRFALVIFATFTVASDKVNALDLVVPAYFDPTDHPTLWDMLADSAAKVQLTVIMNPNSGPGVNVNTAYTNAIRKVRQAGGKVLGYVYTNYTRRDKKEAENDANKYLKLYANDIDGFFFDEMSDNESSEYVQYYQTLYTYVKSLRKNPPYEVINNPGLNVPEIFARLPVADRFMVFENRQANYFSYVPEPWQAKYSSIKFVHAVINALDSDLKNDLISATEKGAEGVFVTSLNLPNPYKDLPSYWKQEVSEVAQMQAA